MVKKFSRALQFALIAAIVLGVFAPATTPVGVGASRANPTLMQRAEAAPDQQLRVIVQKVDDTGRAEALVVSLGGEITKDLHMINAFAAELPGSALLRLSESASVEWVSLDAPMVQMGDDEDICAPDKDGEVPDGCTFESYYLDTLGVREVWDMGFKGDDIGVVVIDSGIQKHKDLDIKKRDKFNPDSRTANDVNGHGTHVAGIIGGNGKKSEGLYSGIAPEAKLIGLKVSDENGSAYESDIVLALQWVLEKKEKYNIRVINLSVNSSVESSYHESPVNAAVEILWLNGVVVVASAGNTMPGSDVNPVNAAPANDPFIITVGASDERATADPSDDVIASFSAHGNTLDGYAKPDIIAPGRNIISVLSNKSAWVEGYEDRTFYDSEYIRLSGTSMAAPMVTGAIALLLQAEPDLTPDQVKYRLMHTGTNLSGYPYLDVNAALTVKTTQSANEGVIPHMLLAKMAMIAYWAYEDCESAKAMVLTYQETVQLVMQDIQSYMDESSGSVDKLEKAHKKLEDAIKELNEESPDKEKAIDKLEEAVRELEDGITDEEIDAQSGLAFMDTLVEVAQQLAVYDVNDCGIGDNDEGEGVEWGSVNWNSVNWNSVNWNSVNWNSVNWNSVNWNSVNWNSVNWNSVNWNSVNWNSVNWNSVNWNSVNWNSIKWNSTPWDD
jgi:serine protease AprX